MPPTNARTTSCNDADSHTVRAQVEIYLHHLILISAYMVSGQKSCASHHVRCAAFHKHYWYCSTLCALDELYIQTQWRRMWPSFELNLGCTSASVQQVHVGAAGTGTTVQPNKQQRSGNHQQDVGPPTRRLGLGCIRDNHSSYRDARSSRCSQPPWCATASSNSSCCQ